MRAAGIEPGSMRARRLYAELTHRWRAQSRRLSAFGACAKTIAQADHDYYLLDQPTLPDAEYDRLMRELQALEAAVSGAGQRRTRRRNASAVHQAASFARFGTRRRCCR